MQPAAPAAGKPVVPIEAAQEYPSQPQLPGQETVRTEAVSESQSDSVGKTQSLPYSEWAVEAAKKPLGGFKQSSKASFDQYLEDTASRMSTPLAQGKQVGPAAPSEQSVSAASAPPPSKAAPVRPSNEEAAPVVQPEPPQGLHYAAQSAESSAWPQQELSSQQMPALIESEMASEAQVFPQQQTHIEYVHPAMESAYLEQAQTIPTRYEDQQIDYFEQIDYVRAESQDIQSDSPAEEGLPTASGVISQSAQMEATEFANEEKVQDAGLHLSEAEFQCPNCSVFLEPNARFCGECGYHLGIRIPSCPLCSAPLEPSAKFCGECGSNITPAHAPLPLSPGGMPGRIAPTQHGWLVKFLKILEK
jgi:hypothetical protein